MELSPVWMDTVSFFETISIAEKNCEKAREDHEPKVQDTNSVGRRNTRNEKSPAVQSKTDRLHDLRLAGEIIKTTAVVFFYKFHDFLKYLGSRVFVQKHNFYYNKDCQ